MLNKKMNQALSAIAEMSVSERELYLALVSDTIEDKDALTSDKETEETEETTYSINHISKVQKSKKHYPKHISKDKAKHGYHRGSKKGGYGDWDKFGKPEKLNKDRNKDLQAQLTELGLMESDISIEEAVMLLEVYCPWNDSKEFSVENLYYWPVHDYDTLDSNVQYVYDLYKEEVNKLWNFKKKLYSMVDTLFIEMGMTFQNKVVTQYMGEIVTHLAEVKERMTEYLVNQYRNHRLVEMMCERARHETEMSRLNVLLAEADKYLK